VHLLSSHEKLILNKEKEKLEKDTETAEREDRAYPPD